MKSLKPVLKKIRTVVDKKVTDLPRLVGVMGDGFGNLYSDTARTMVYVRFGENTKAIPVFNNRVPAENGLQVVVGATPEQPRLQQVLSTYSNKPGGETGGIIGGYAPAQRYEWLAPSGGQDPLYIHKRAITDLNIYVTKPPSMSVQLMRGVVYVSGVMIEVPQATYDHTTNIPATVGKAVLILHTINDAGTNVQTVSSEFDVADLMPEGDRFLNMPAIPAGTVFVRGLVRVYNGQAAVQEARTNNDIVDLRFAGYTGSATGGGASTYNLYLDMMGVDVVDNIVTVVDDAAYNSLPSVTVLSNGDLLAVYRDGTSHATDKGIIVKQTSTDNGATWSAQSTVYTDATRDSRDPSLRKLLSGRIILTFFKNDYSTPVHIVDACHVIYSDDDGATWSTPYQINSSFTQYDACSSPVVELDDGTLLFTTYGKNSADTYEHTKIFASSDEGETWSERMTLAASASRHYQEPNLAKMQDGTLICLMRSDTPDMDNGNIYSSISSDDGYTWSTPQIAFQGSGSPRMLAIGGLLIVMYRKTTDTSYITAYRISSNGGASWGAETDFDNSSGMMVYAGLVEYEIGLIAVVYAIEKSSTNADVYFRRMAETLSTGIFKSVVPTGTAPLQVLSTTVVENLNVDLLDGNHADAFSLAGHEHVSASGELLMQDGVTAPPVPIETEDQTDWLYQG